MVFIVTRNVDLRIVLLGLFWINIIACTPKYVLPEPIIISISPLSGKVGTQLTISGSTLDGNSTFSINGTITPIITRYSSKRVLVSIPADATTGKLKATNESGSGYSTEIFEVLSR